jgi:hypothetical protein
MANVRRAGIEKLSEVLPKKSAEKVLEHLK